MVEIEWVGIFGNQYWFTLHLFIYVALFLVQRSVVDLVLHALPKKKALAWEVILHIVFTIGIYYFIHDGILRLYPAAANILPIVRTRLACLYPYLGDWMDHWATLICWISFVPQGVCCYCLYSFCCLHRLLDSGS